MNFNFSVFLFFVFSYQNLEAQVGLQVSKLSFFTLEIYEFEAASNFNARPQQLENSTDTAFFHPFLNLFQPSPSVPGGHPIAFNLEHEGFFCKLELDMEKKVKVLFPLKFRLGEFNYEERLEGKQPLNPLRY